MKKRKARKRLSILLCIVFAFSMFPVATSAAEGDVEYLYCDENGDNWQTGTKADGKYTLVASDNTSWSDGWYVVEGNITNSNRISVSGNVHLILKDGCTLNATSGILVSRGNSLTIYGQSLGTGKLVATAWTDGGDAGIGGVHHSTAGSITINGGNIEATGYNGGAGIGGGHAGAPQSVTINGGNVIANGGACSGNGSGAGIGCGYATSGGTVKINGGTVAANGNGKANQNAPGIGGGSSISSDNTTVIINGGVVTATCIDNSVSGISGNFSTGTDGNAVIFTNSISDQSGKENWNGVIFEDNNGSVYGTSITITDDFTVESGKTLTVADGQTLTIPVGVTLTNNGIITNNGTIANNGTITNNGTYTGNAPKYSATYLDADGAEQTAICNVITADNIGEYTTINSGWYVVQGEVSTDTRITVSGTVHLILTDGCTFTAGNGIQVQDTNALTVYAQANGTGTLTATGGAWAAGIGGSGGNITINGGIVNATGGNFGAGIGGGGSSSNGNNGGTVTINGGTVIATGGIYAAGIGGGAGGIDAGRYTGGSGANVTINGGTVIATSKKTVMNTYAPGIGGGIGNTTGGAGGSLTVTGGYVVTNGIGGAGSKNGNSPGANGTFSVSGNSVVISGYIKDSADTSGWSGIVFIGNSGTIYGTSVAPEEDFEIPGGKTLTIANGQTLTIPSGVTLTNNGTIIIEEGGTLINNGTIINNGSVYVDGVLSGSFGGTGSIYYPLTVNGGTAGGDTSTYQDKVYGKAGGTVTLTGTDVPVGQAVSGWTVSDSGVIVENNAFTMPAKALTVSLDGYVNAPTYTVTIPATVELGEEITISATGVSVVSGSQLEVKLTGTSEADNAFLLKTDEGAQLNYGITKDSTALVMGSTVLTVAGGTADNTGTANLSFVKQGSEAYAGAYKGTVTFTVSVEEVISP